MDGPWTNSVDETWTMAGLQFKKNSNEPQIKESKTRFNMFPGIDLGIILKNPHDRLLTPGP